VVLLLEAVDLVLEELMQHLEQEAQEAVDNLEQEYQQETQHQLELQEEQILVAVEEQ
tara:strand:+ start:754 stop:924 length:171 start_codon:yes stop_codon:yes gene_type:complete